MMPAPMMRASHVFTFWIVKEWPREERERGRSFLRECDLMSADYCAVNSVGQREARIETNLWILRLQIFFDKQFQDEVRYLNAVQ